MWAHINKQRHAVESCQQTIDFDGCKFFFFFLFGRFFLPSGLNRVKQLPTSDIESSDSSKVPKQPDFVPENPQDDALIKDQALCSL